MTKMLRVDDDVHEIITKLAKKDERTITAFLNRTFRGDGAMFVHKDVLETATPQKKLEGKTLEEQMEAREIKRQEDEGAKIRINDMVKLSIGEEPSLPNLRPIELPCCKQPLPCKHWSWDTATGEGYVNSLSGRIREA